MSGDTAKYGYSCTTWQEKCTNPTQTWNEQCLPVFERSTNLFTLPQGSVGLLWMMHYNIYYH